MISKYKISNAYSINLVCERCSKDTEYKELDVNTLQYKYICPHCGAVQISDVRYPYTKIEVDIKSRELSEIKPKYKI